jgi:hypothetical protein
MILHPELSRYTLAHPEYKPFGQTDLIDNGYISDDSYTNSERCMILHPTHSHLASHLNSPADGTIAPHSSPVISSPTNRSEFFGNDVEMINLTESDNEDMKMDIGEFY